MDFASTLAGMDVSSYWNRPSVVGETDGRDGGAVGMDWIRETAPMRSLAVNWVGLCRRGTERDSEPSVSRVIDAYEP